ncbi:hemagglutinin/amebocyte aggregation factor-like [Elysia marginata]|uniref:Hemagglutinin/amebocyte aggregation factor-like n=1 Tax=Elysia marginata TaxID=1093978 RepID=A0AAV4H9C6_9GAST|nr:hemagglutinin/amebocyte aggregation factor-like [Elysia marginata]
MSRSSMVVVLRVLAAAIAVTHAYFKNDWDQPLSFDCPFGQVLSTIRSADDASAVDQRWRFGCKDAPPGIISTRTCRYRRDETGWFACGGDYVVRGFMTIPGDGPRGRQTVVLCCGSSATRRGTCNISDTDSINEPGAPVDYTVPSGKVIVGWNTLPDGRIRIVECAFNQQGD